MSASEVVYQAAALELLCWHEQQVADVKFAGLLTELYELSHRLEHHIAVGEVAELEAELYMLLHRLHLLH